jgi:hypothetical protein
MQLSYYLVATDSKNILDNRLEKCKQAKKALIDLTRQVDREVKYSTTSSKREGRA